MRTEESIDKIIAAGAVPRLIELMASGDMEVKRNSTGALANISSADRTCSTNNKVFSDQRTQTPTIVFLFFFFGAMQMPRSWSSRRARCPSCSTFCAATTRPSR